MLAPQKTSPSHWQHSTVVDGGGNVIVGVIMATGVLGLSEKQVEDVGGGDAVVLSTVVGGLVLVDAG